MMHGDESRLKWRWVLCFMSVAVVETKRDCFAITSLGAVKGSKEKSQIGNSFCSFRGIPYAAPPTGQLRFRAPQSPKPWTGVLNAKHTGPMCIQKILSIVVGQEDCLYLNVYTPEPIPESREKLLPVILYIHGGRFTIGSGISFVTGPTYLMNKQIVLVTINYRLGIMGFLSTGDNEAPGNYAMKDQVAALRWVRDNIAEFSGDPDKITLQGESAGSKSVQFHMFSPSSKGLFHGAISQSGSVFMPWTLPPAEPLLNAKVQAQAFSCPTNDSSSIIRCLRGIEARDLVLNEMRLWQPVIEMPSPSNPEPFLTATPLDLVKIGNFYKVPWLMGSNSQDGALFGARNIADPRKRALFNENIDTDGPREALLDLSLSSNLIPEVWNELKQFYFSSKNNASAEELIKTPCARGISYRGMAWTVVASCTVLVISFDSPEGVLYNDTILGAVDYKNKGTAWTVVTSCTVLVISFDSPEGLYTDRYVVHAVHKASMLHSVAGHEPIYRYNFAYRGLYSYAKVAEIGSVQMDLGVVHMDDLIYLIPTHIFNIWPPGHPDTEVINLMVTLWTNFATYRNPTPRGLWEPFNIVDKNYLEIGHNESKPALYGIKPVKLEMKHGLYAERMNFWDSLPLKENQ